ncbi:MAG: DUF357 domain-containing protein [Candidatus Bathyarchaeota archaeon]|nr:DUF357 domain-containing protein [Candidatus Bathyarchaeota archaeon]
MSAEELAVKYIRAMEQTLQGMQRRRENLQVSKQCIDEVFGYVNAYLQDAKYFYSQKQYETSLVSIAYCEGLLDALKLIGAAQTPNSASPLKGK